MQDQRHPREKRKFGRRRMTCHAWITINRRWRMACVVVNLSERGALLRFLGPLPSANRFRLKIEDPRLVADCDVRHRTKDAVGVFFAEVDRSDALKTSRGAREIVFKVRHNISP